MTLSVSRITAPVFLRRRGHGQYLRFLAEAEAAQWKSPEEIRVIQQEKLARLVQHAVRSVPYYTGVFAELGVGAADIRDRDDLVQLPLLTKGIIQAQTDELITTGLDKATLHEKSSSGSTGTPTRVYVDAHRDDWGWAYNTRHNRWAGLDWGVKLGNMFAAPQSLAARGRGSGVTRFLRDIEKVLAGDLRQVSNALFQLGDDAMESFAAELVRLKPDILLGYANGLLALATFVQKHGISGIRPRGIITGAEPLYPEVRNVLESVFGARVFNRYGTRELDIIASECERWSLHVNDDNLIVEIIEVPGESYGRVVVTDLNSLAMPLIRYDLEDYATRLHTTCACGRGLSLLGGIEGRTGDMLRKRDGGLVHPSVIRHELRQIKEIGAFQMHQRDFDLFDAFVVTSSEEPLEALLAPIIVKVREFFGNQAVMRIHRVSEIKQAGNGKFRFIISDLR